VNDRENVPLLKLLLEKTATDLPKVEFSILEPDVDRRTVKYTDIELTLKDIYQNYIINGTRNFMFVLTDNMPTVFVRNQAFFMQAQSKAVYTFPIVLREKCVFPVKQPNASQTKQSKLVKCCI